MKKIILLAVFCLSQASVFAQATDSLNFGPEPEGGVSNLTLLYYKIDFRPSQRITLNNSSLELIFMVDALGRASLDNVKGTQDKSILDSLYSRASTLPRFTPRTVNGEAVASSYSFTLVYPRYESHGAVPEERPHQDRPLTADDFQGAEVAERVDIVIGGVVNGFGGSAQGYLGVGGGMKIELMMRGKNKFGGGIVMNFYGNPSRRDYPISTPQPQNKTPVTLLVGLAVSRDVIVEDRREVILQMEINYAMQNISPSSQDQNDYVQLKGFSPGFTLHYALPLGKQKLSMDSYRPILYKHHVDFHAALRPVFYNVHEATGVMWEAGVSYRLGCSFLSY
ncbi:hypothetical protein [Chryseolinea lacunae]|uniref:Uncharacterized protein n=1 Tax=Chryseolinea lacunae TaxID=2801331 RepID=A0ABS1KVF1_9BACT|nr:hypothetical protein [Chryseolinea lacunae]MBL0743440.1 hypothetical protein [Chryseolinea lacunae]